MAVAGFPREARNETLSRVARAMFFFLQTGNSFSNNQPVMPPESCRWCLRFRWSQTVACVPPYHIPGQRGRLTVFTYTLSLHKSSESLFFDPRTRGGSGNVGVVHNRCGIKRTRVGINTNVNCTSVRRLKEVLPMTSPTLLSSVNTSLLLQALIERFDNGLSLDEPGSAKYAPEPFLNET